MNSSEHTAYLRDKLTGALIGLARATDGNEHLISESSTAVVIAGLAATLPNVDCGAAALERLIKQVEEEKRKMVPDCFLCANPCGKNNAYDMKQLLEEEPEIRTLKLRILEGAREMSALGYRDGAVDSFLYKALVVVGIGGYSEKHLLPIVQELDELMNRCLAAKKA